MTSAELAGVEKADALLVSRKVEYEDVWDLRNAGDVYKRQAHLYLLQDNCEIGIKEKQ